MSEKRGKYQTEMEWARAHKGDPLADQLVALAQLYALCPEPGALGLIDAACEDIRRALAADAPAGEEQSNG